MVSNKENGKNGSKVSPPLMIKLSENSKKIKKKD